MLRAADGQPVLGWNQLRRCALPPVPRGRHQWLETQAIFITCNRQDFLALAGTAPETGLIILNRRRTRTAECQHLLAWLARAGESGLNKNINFAWRTPLLHDGGVARSNRFATIGPLDC